MGFLSKWERIINPNGIVARALRGAPGMSSDQLSKATGLSTGKLYPVLARMEHTGRIRSAWVDGPYPRRRLYYLIEGNP